MFIKLLVRYNFMSSLTHLKHKRNQKLAHVFLRVSVCITFVTIGQAGEAGWRLKEIEFDKLLEHLHKPLTYSTSMSHRMCSKCHCNVVVCTLNKWD